MLDINSLFDESYYIASNADVRQAVSAGIFANGLAHFNLFGKFENRNPSAFFDSAFYLEQNPDVSAAVQQKIITPTDHFLGFGQKEKRDPIAEFYTNTYLQKNPDVKAAVDRDILTTYEHFIKSGQLERRDPGGDFVTNFYLQQNSDVANAVNIGTTTAIKHYLQFGQKEGRISSNILPGDTLEQAKQIRSLTSNKLLLGSVTDNNPTAIYSFTLSQTSLVNLKLDGLSADADIEIAKDFNRDGLIDFSEELDFSEEEGTTPENLSLNLTPGTYFVQVYQYEEGQNTPYRLNLQATPFVTPATILNQSLKGAVSLGSIGGVDTYQGTLNKATPVHIYSFSLDENRDFSLSLKDVSANASIQLIRDFNNNQIIDPNEVIDAKTATSSSPGIISFNRQEAGDYFILLQSQGSDTNYQLTLEAPGSGSTGTEDIQAIASNETVQGNLSLGDTPNSLRPSSPSIDYLLTDVVANQQVSINLTSSQFDTALQVVKVGTDELVAENDNLSPGNTNSALSFTPEPGEDYIIRVTSFADPEFSTGDFTLTTNAASPIVGNLALGQTINDNLGGTDLVRSSPDGESQQFSNDYLLTGITPGQQVQINLSSTQFDTYLELIDRATAEVIAENDDISNPTNRNSQLNFTAQPGIEYVVRVTSFADQATGNYTLSAGQSSGASVASLALSSASSQDLVKIQDAGTSAASDDFLNNLEDQQIKEIFERRITNGELNRNGMLEIYKQVGTDGKISEAEFADLTTLAKEKTAFTMPDSIRYLATNVVQGMKADKSATNFENQVAKWFKGTVRPEPKFTDEDKPTKTNFYEYQAVQGNLFGSNGPTLGDIAQNPFSDCYYLAGLGALFGSQRPPEGTTDKDPFRGNTTSQVIKNAIFANTNDQGNFDGTYTIRFFNKDTGKAEYVVIDNQLITKNGEIAGSARDTAIDNAENVLWVPLMERAYAQWLGSYDKMGNGGIHEYVLQQMKKGEPTEYDEPTKVDFQVLVDAFKNGKSVTVSGPKDKNGLIFSGHAYAMTDAYVDPETEEQRVVLYNPHGQDAGATAGVSGDEKDVRVTLPRSDGFVTLTFDEFKKTATRFAVL
ncbi:pre-peptidase C-terminal domain-containing protein [Floridanema aerugineum]|uniref:Pre-peptidase C-terminal domain-containing protein n=1 Tax=Floridaenema aerugineum BLCC-F46 TaxID=3153654 RepID=A0ABV4X047_9CYAN